MKTCQRNRSMGRACSESALRIGRVVGSKVSQSPHPRRYVSSLVAGPTHSLIDECLTRPWMERRSFGVRVKDDMDTRFQIQYGLESQYSILCVQAKRGLPIGLTALCRKSMPLLTHPVNPSFSLYSFCSLSGTSPYSPRTPVLLSRRLAQRSRALLHRQPWRPLGFLGGSYPYLQILGSD